MTVQSILQSIGIGAKDAGVNIWDGLKSLTTLEGLSNLALMMTPRSLCSDEMLMEKFQIYDNIASSIKTGYNEFVEGDWKLKPGVTTLLFTITTTGLATGMSSHITSQKLEVKF